MACVGSPASESTWRPDALSQDVAIVGFALLEHWNTSNIQSPRAVFENVIRTLPKSDLTQANLTQVMWHEIGALCEADLFP